MMPSNALIGLANSTVKPPRYKRIKGRLVNNVQHDGSSSDVLLQTKTWLSPLIAPAWYSVTERATSGCLVSGTQWSAPIVSWHWKCMPRSRDKSKGLTSLLALVLAKKKGMHSW